MNPFQESLARTSASDTKSLQSLLKVAEELLFSFPLPVDIVKKYEFMRESAFAKLGLQHSFTRIWNLQREAHTRTRGEKVSFAAQTNPPGSAEGPAGGDMRDQLLRAYKKTIESTLIDLDSFLETLRLILGVVQQRGATQMFISDLDTYKTRKGTEEVSAQQQLKVLQGELAARIQSFGDIYTEVKNVLLVKDKEVSDAEAKTAEALKTISRITSQYEDQLHAVERTHLDEKSDLEASLVHLQEQKEVAQDQSFHEAHRNYLQEIETLLREKDKAQEGFRLLQMEFDRSRASSKMELEQVHGVYKKEMEFLSQNLRSEIEKMKKMHYTQLEELRTTFEKRRQEEQSTQSSQQRSDLTMLRKQVTETEETAFQAMQTLSELQRRIAALYLRYSGGLAVEWRAEEGRVKEALGRQLDSHMMSNHMEAFLHLEFLSFVVTHFTTKVGKLSAALENEQQEKRILEHRIASREVVKPAEKFKTVIEDMKYAASVQKDFEEARLRLVGHFPSS